MVTSPWLAHEFKYSPYRALFSSKYIRCFYPSEASHSPSLKKLDEGLIERLAEDDIDWANNRRRILALLLLLSMIYVVGILQISIQPWLLIVQVGGGIALLVIELFLFMSFNRLHHAQDAANKLFFAVLVLERDNQCGNTTKSRWAYAARLERLAREIERIPLALGRVAPTVRRECLGTSRAKAQAIRQLEISVVKPTPSTFEDLATRLIDDLRLIIEGRWYDLPEAQYERQISRSKLIAQISGAVLT
jgi:hypothetical protein